MESAENFFFLQEKFAESEPHHQGICRKFEQEKLFMISPFTRKKQPRQHTMPNERPENGSRPRMLLAYTDAAYASQCGRYFRRLGWEVQMVADGMEARELADRTCPDVIVLDAALLDPSGWLCREKTHNPESHIVLVVDRRTNDVNQCLVTAGASQAVYREDGAQALVETIFGKSTFSEAI